MTTRLAPFVGTAALAALLVLGACSRGAENNLAALDNSLLANGVDPALTSALEDQILVDPNLVQQAHPNTVRPPEMPVQAQYPAESTAGESGRPGVRRTAAVSGDGGCADRLDYGPQWADRLPPEFPSYPGARLTEAAGSDAGDCHIRVVTFRTGDPFDRVLAHYRALAARAGFSAEHQQRGADHLLGGVHPRTDGAFVLIVTPGTGGSDVALIVNRGR